MEIIIHRGTHRIGGIAAEIRTGKTRIIIDMGDELSLDPDFVPEPLNITGVTDEDGTCDAVLFTHHHGDHTGQMLRIREDIPLYAGALAKDIMLMSAQRRQQKEDGLLRRLEKMRTFCGGETFTIGDVRITPWSIDHSACDSYLFLLEADGKRILYTGDFRTHGFRGKCVPKILRKIGSVDVLITEGTALSRPDIRPMTEYELQQKVKEYLQQYRYVFVLCASSNLERICALAKAVSGRKVFVCDRYQSDLLELLEKHWGHLSALYRNIRKYTYGGNILSDLRENGFLMTVRDNREFRRIIPNFDPEHSIMLYSMWDGYRTRPGSTIPDFLNLAGRWETLHTSGHASHGDIRALADAARPNVIIPMHTEAPDMLQTVCPDAKVRVLNDGEVFSVGSCRKDTADS